MNVLCLWLVLLSLCQSANAVWPETQFQAVNYLLRYGYLNPDYSMQTNPSKFLHYAVKNFQKKSSLEMTGKIDEPTLRQMQKKRCGVPDFSRQKFNQIFHGPEISITLNKRDATRAYWEKTDLTYYIKNYTEDLSKEVTDETVKKALQVWAHVSKLTFTKVNDSTADIVVEFAQGEHGDGVPFDGPGGTLAHAYFPEMNTNPLEGDAHFDEDETWVVGAGKNGTNLFCTAVHEFGHSLGLSHTYNGEDIMFPFERGCSESVLSEWDIASIQELYGKPENSVTTTQSAKEPTITTKPTTLEPTTLEPTTLEPTTLEPTTLEPTTLEPTTTTTTVPTTTASTTTSSTTPATITTTSTEKPSTPSYTTTNVTTLLTTSLDRSTSSQIELPTRRPIVPFPELCNGIPDAMTYGVDGNLYVFIELLVFVLDSKGLVYDDYKVIADIFPRAPNTVDAAFTVNVDNYKKNGHVSFTYLIQGENVWKYYFHSEYQQFQLTHGYPRHQLKDFSHAPIMIRAAFFVNGITYLIDHDYYMAYRYDCERSTFEPLEHSKSLMASNYFRNFPKGSSIDATWVSDDGNLNILAEYDWYVIDSTGDIKNRSKTVTLFWCEVVPDRHKHSPHRRKNSPHKRKHSPHKRKHSPHKRKHSPHKRKNSPHKRKHSQKKRKKSPKRGRHRRNRQRKLYN